MTAGAAPCPRRGRRAAARSPAAELRQLAADVLRLHDPFRTDPERSLIAKHEIAGRLRRLATEIE